MRDTIEAIQLEAAGSEYDTADWLTFVRWAYNSIDKEDKEWCKHSVDHNNKPWPL